jgi:hypothetical protein
VGYDWNAPRKRDAAEAVRQLNDGQRFNSTTDYWQAKERNDSRDKHASLRASR